MLKNRTTNRKGLTLVELMVAAAIGGIVMFGVAIILADGQRGWNAMYNRTYSDVVTDGHIARRTFDRVIRKASSNNITLDDADLWVEVRYYQDANSIVVDRYARFYEADGQLNIEYGRPDPRETLSIQTICGNVSGCVFKAQGASVQMILTLDNGSQTATVVSSAVAHN
jgi:prepilin-type N-terminal cleavage/methylation domain-containing protein